MVSGLGYYWKGCKLLWHPQLRVYILVPVLVNLFLFVALTAALVQLLGDVFSYGQSGLENWLPSWLSFLGTVTLWIVWIIVGCLLLLFYGYSFNLLTNIIAAPFYGLLAQRTEELLRDTKLPEEALSKMIPRVFLRELGKLWYFATRGLLVLLVFLLLGLIPLVQIAAPLIPLAWGAWSMAVQYVDYAADNNQLQFKPTRQKLWQMNGESFGFGGMVTLLSIVPVLNIIASPAAVIGGTVFWVDRLSQVNNALVQRSLAQ